MSVQAYEGKRELRWLRLDACVIAYVEANQAIDAALWDAWVAALADPRTETAIMCAWGPTRPSTEQWRGLTKLLKDKQLHLAVVTQDRHNAALAKKAAWVGAKIESFKWDDTLYEPFVFLGFGLDERRQFKPKVFGLRDCHGPVDSGADPRERVGSGPTGRTERAREMPAWMREGGSVRSATLTRVEQGAGSRDPSARAASTGSEPNAETSSLAQARAAKNSALVADFRRSRDAVFRSSSDIQAKLAEVQARLRARNLETERSRS